MWQQLAWLLILMNPKSKQTHLKRADGEQTDSPNWGESVEKLGCNKELCVFQCGRRKWRSAALPVATGGLEPSEIFGGADEEPLCIQQRREAAFEVVGALKKRKRKSCSGSAFCRFYK